MEFAFAVAMVPILQRGFYTPSLGLGVGTSRMDVLPERQGMPVLQALSLQVFREGEATADPKVATLFVGDEPVGSAAFAYFRVTAGPQVQKFKTELLRGQFLVQVTDNGSPRLGLLRWPVLDAGTSALSYNLTEGQGGGIVTHPAKVPAGARVDDLRKIREVVVLERQADGQWRVAGAGFTAEDALKDIDLEVTDAGTWYALGMDDWGVLFEPGLAVTKGQRVRPSQFEGWLYEITEAGNLPATEPAWWPIQGENPSRQIGTARALAVRYYQPLGHGPFPVEMI
ncbi:hypothetical protein [Pseudomonas nitroreducens]|uniref:Uncharacterized protein n=1 Tax=Pseudomonas nitroreducens TaxID=46680 RepID=A0A2D0ADW8_PSENT|nr:hypothetical protein [Pseudomonas nitroreducens]OWP50274.1 hypothetical protein CEG18_12025 [Pseudomonas nitroreducens]